MEDDEKLKKVAKEIGKELEAGNTEIDLNQPNPEQFQVSGANDDKNTSTTAASVSANGKSESSQPSDRSDENNKDQSILPIAATKGDENRIILFLVVIGIVVCIIGVILAFAVSLLIGLIAMIIGALVIAFGILSPVGY
jgi:Flp pilus assembly protein TadB